MICKTCSKDVHYARILDGEYTCFACINKEFVKSNAPAVKFSNKFKNVKSYTKEDIRKYNVNRYKMNESYDD